MQQLRSSAFAAQPVLTSVAVVRTSSWGEARRKREKWKGNTVTAAKALEQKELQSQRQKLFGDTSLLNTWNQGKLGL